MSEDKDRLDWVRGPKQADLSNVPVDKLIRAHKERGIQVDLPKSGKGKSKVIKTVVTGMPAPKKK